MKTISLSCAVMLVAGAAGAAEVVAPKAVAPTSPEVVAAALDSNLAIAARVRSIKAFPQTQEIVAGVDKAMADIAAAQDQLNAVYDRVWNPHPDIFGKSDEVMAAAKRAEDAAARATPDGHDLAHGYYAIVPRIMSSDPDGPVAEGDAAMEVAIANMQRAAAEIDKQAARMMADLIQSGDREYGYRDIRAIQARADAGSRASEWDALKKRIETQKSAASLKEKAAFAMPASRMRWDDN